MGKKSKRNRSKASSLATATQAPPSIRTSKNEGETKETLRFQDPFVEEVVTEDTPDSNENDAKPAAVVQKSWNPLTGEALGKDETLEMDPSAYKMYHDFTNEWPSLSFDWVPDELGSARTRFPHCCTAAIGTQANTPENNQLTILKISDLSKIQVETEDDILGEEFNPDAETDDNSESEDEVDLDPVMEHYSVPHYGGINRVRVMPQQPDICATWSDTGHVNLFNVSSIRQRFSKQQQVRHSNLPSKPFFSHQHSTEGFAMDWSKVKQGQLATGDCSGAIHLWTPRPEGSHAVEPFYNSTVRDCPDSVEDLQWSPTEATVFASAQCGGSVKIFDTRAPNKAMLDQKIHTNGSDVNVLSWNAIVSNLLATGGDDGTLSVWDLRHFSKSPLPLARFTPHTTPITSVEWHPTDESMLAASDDVGCYIYDLSVEEDDNTGEVDVPPQLLFVHCGSEQFKEIHWHPQISSCLMSTALTGFSVFIPSNL